MRTGNRLFYLAAPPSAYPSIIDGLGEAGLGGRVARAKTARAGRASWWRSPSDTTGARRPSSTGGSIGGSREDEVYRIDHYLGKETVQNILVFRLANGIFEPVWNRQ